MGAKVPIDKILANYKCLRTLDLSYLGIKILPGSIGKLIHLRYLNLSNNPDLEVLPKSIIKLYNLQTLNLDRCEGLKDLPKDLGNLVNVRVLGLQGYYNLMFMPSGMSKLTDLHTLPKYVLGKGTSCRRQHFELEALKALKKLRGDIEIVIYFPKNGPFVGEDILREGLYMKDKVRLNRVCFRCIHEERYEEETDYEEKLLGALQPHANLMELRLDGYLGVRMPRWANEDKLAFFLPNLVQLDLHYCRELQCLPLMGKLQFRKYLTLYNLPKLEYIESHPEIISARDGSSGEGLSVLPSLEKLSLQYLPKLKEWRGSPGESQSSLFVSRLIYLEIWGCPEFTSLPSCPNVEKFNLYSFNERLRLIRNPTSYLKLKDVKIDSMAWLSSSLPAESFQSLTHLDISDDSNLESLDDFGQVFQACSSSLRTLEIWRCSKLRRVSGGFGYLTALERLSLHSLPIVNLADEVLGGDDEGDGMPWGSLQNSLHHLNIYNCKEVKTFPKWMQKLMSLQQLRVHGCSEELYQRCLNPNGEDWPNIQHILNIDIE